MNKSYIPVVIEQTGRKEVSYDIYSRLLKDRIVVLNGEIEDYMASVIVAQLLYLDNESNEDITMYINSPGGVITSGLSVYDTMKYIKSKVITVCIGQAASMGAFLLSSGDHRVSLPNARIMIHQPSGGSSGQATDIEIQAKEILRLKDILNKYLSEQTGQTIKKIKKDTDRDFFMSAKEALEYGLIDEVIESNKKR